jgi:hypothetical protein
VGDYLTHLGFVLPDRVTRPRAESCSKKDCPGHVPADGQPRKGPCDFCRRDRLQTYVRFDGRRMCDLCLDSQVNRTRFVRARPRAQTGDVRPQELVGLIGDRFAEKRPEGSDLTYQTYWENQIA